MEETRIKMIQFCPPDESGLLKERFSLEIRTNRTKIGIIFFPSKKYRKMLEPKFCIYLKSKKYYNDKKLIKFLKDITGIKTVVVSSMALIS
jgi:hypothetical protein